MKLKSIFAFGYLSLCVLQTLSPDVVNLSRLDTYADVALKQATLTLTEDCGVGELNPHDLIEISCITCFNGKAFQVAGKSNLCYVVSDNEYQRLHREYGRSNFHCLVFNDEPRRSPAEYLALHAQWSEGLRANKGREVSYSSFTANYRYGMRDCFTVRRQRCEVVTLSHALQHMVSNYEDAVEYDSWFGYQINLNGMNTETQTAFTTIMDLPNSLLLHTLLSNHAKANSEQMRRSYCMYIAYLEERMRSVVAEIRGEWILVPRIEASKPPYAKPQEPVGVSISDSDDEIVSDVGGDEIVSCADLDDDIYGRSWSEPAVMTEVEEDNDSWLSESDEPDLPDRYVYVTHAVYNELQRRAQIRIAHGIFEAACLEVKSRPIITLHSPIDGSPIHVFDHYAAIDMSVAELERAVSATGYCADLLVARQKYRGGMRVQTLA